MNADWEVVGNMDVLTSEHPHADDPRFLPQRNYATYCMLRFTQFCRCVRELGEDDVHCKYQFYRAQTCCPSFQLDEWMEHRARGTSEFDLLPDRQTDNMRLG